MTFIGVLLTASLAAFATGTSTFPFVLPCSSVSGTPCTCPPGTNYAESLTAVIIGATAGNVGSVTNNFFNPEWAGLTIWTVQGPNNFPGLSTRSVNFTTSIGEYTFTERLSFRFVFPDGSFEQRYEQRGLIPYRSGNGSFAGSWTTLKGDRIFANQTLVRFSNYACQTGHPIDFAQFHEVALTNATNIITTRGLVWGVNTVPVSAQLF
ncbi:hypothetical protein SAMD00023353_3700860 [Rosellinia necatrix]|uniref:Uncharacterized protein n=1 Tax=Rosellinia necatrix TaxID=77044 RepID=A0A1W2TM09_ROSNE|nr:hypothetical protein SAMD00023353_3700860 [Rosellinia necatrix]